MSKRRFLGGVLAVNVEAHGRKHAVVRCNLPVIACYGHVHRALVLRVRRQDHAVRSNTIGLPFRRIRDTDINVEL